MQQARGMYKNPWRHNSKQLKSFIFPVYVSAQLKFNKSDTKMLEEWGGECSRSLRLRTLEKTVLKSFHPISMFGG